MDGLLAARYQGCVITNHFYYGNTGVERSLPWPDFVRPYAEDYEALCACAAQYDLDILFGVEEGVGLGLYIVKTILNTYKEDITVTSEDGYTEFTFTLSEV